MPTFGDWLLSEQIPLNGRLAKIYGGTLPADADFQFTKLGDQPRVGLISHPLLLAGFAHHDASSPIHRGVFLTRNVLGRTLRPPPIAIAPDSPDTHPDLTTRQRVAQQTSAAMCQTCHATINPLGFSLENFDAVGRYREEENGQADRRYGEVATWRRASRFASPGRENWPRNWWQAEEVQTRVRRATLPSPGQTASAGLWGRPAR